MKRSLFGVLYLLLLLCMLSACGGHSESEPPAPPAPLVDDRAGVLTPSTVERIEQEGAVLRDLTGVEVVVATADFLGGKEIADYATGLFDARQPGAKKNNGLLLLLCVGQEDYYLLAGEGLGEAMRSDQLLSLLDRSAEADFAAENYDAAAQKTFDGLKAEAETLYGVSVSGELARREIEAGQPPAKDKKRLLPLFPIAFFLLAGLMFFLCLFGRRRRRRNVRYKN